MTATVLRVNAGSLLVKDSIHQEVLVHFRNARRFSQGDHIRITFNGQMTRSIPPQITATSIQRIHNPAPRPPQSTPTKIRAVILQKRRGSLLVRNISNNRQLLVHSPHSRHYCTGQRIAVQYDAMIMNNPPEVNAIDIEPIC